MDLAYRYGENALPSTENIHQVVLRLCWVVAQPDVDAVG